MCDPINPTLSTLHWISAGQGFQYFGFMFTHKFVNNYPLASLLQYYVVIRKPNLQEDFDIHFLKGKHERCHQ
jgi:hypothetical protein